jgi:competence protein ComEC
VRRYLPPGRISAGEILRIPGATIEVLAPARPVPGAGNDDSTVLRVRAGDLTVLLPGDVEEEGVRRLLNGERDLSADVLVLPHHGHPHPEARALTRAVGPTLMVASDGPGAVLDALWGSALRTSRHGAITVYAGGRWESFLSPRTPAPPRRR